MKHPPPRQPGVLTDEEQNNAAAWIAQPRPELPVCTRNTIIRIIMENKMRLATSATTTADALSAVLDAMASRVNEAASADGEKAGYDAPFIQIAQAYLRFKADGDAAAWAEAVLSYRARMIVEQGRDEIRVS